VTFREIISLNIARVFQLIREFFAVGVTKYVILW